MSLREIKSLVDSVTAAQPRDPRQQVALLDRINSLKELMKQGEQQDLVAYLETASVLTEALAGSSPLTPERISQMVSKLVKQVKSTFDTGNTRVLSAGEADETVTLQESSSSEASSLRMLHDQCLGEILIQIGSASREDVEEGLRAQRATGVRIGEALVMLGKVTWEQVDSAVRLQEKLRTTVASASGLSLKD